MMRISRRALMMSAALGCMIMSSYGLAEMSVHADDDVSDARISKTIADIINSSSSSSERTKEEIIADEKIPKQSTESILLKLKWVKTAGDAVLVSSRLRRNALNLAETFFANGGESFRSGKPYYEEYALEKITSTKEIERLQVSGVSDLKAEISTLKADLQAFLDSKKMNHVIETFTKQNSQMIAHLKKIKAEAPWLESLTGMIVPQEGEKSGQMLANLETYLNSTYTNLIPNANVDRRGHSAAMYVFASIFHNNDTKIAFLYDNEEVIKHMGAYIAETYGSNPLLTFVIETAPFIDVINRRLGLFNSANVKWFWSQYKWYVIGSATLLGTVYFSYPRLMRASTGGESPTAPSSTGSCCG